MRADDIRPGDRCLIRRNVLPWKGCRAHAVGRLVTVDRHVSELSLVALPRPPDGVHGWVGPGWVLRTPLLCHHCKRALLFAFPDAALSRIPTTSELIEHDRAAELRDAAAARGLTWGT